jgi:hypothetical protein
MGTPPEQHHDPNTEIDRLLRSSRPEPADAFGDRLERRLFGKRRTGRVLALPRAVLAGAVAAAAAALVFLALALAGTGPLGGSDGVDASSKCHYVKVTKRTRVPIVVRDASGKDQIRFVHRNRAKLVKRCG